MQVFLFNSPKRTRHHLVRQIVVLVKSCLAKKSTFAFLCLCWFAIRTVFYIFFLFEVFMFKNMPFPIHFRLKKKKKLFTNISLFFWNVGVSISSCYLCYLGFSAISWWVSMTNNDEPDSNNYKVTADLLTLSSCRWWGQACWSSASWPLSMAGTSAPPKAWSHWPSAWSSWPSASPWDWTVATRSTLPGTWGPGSSPPWQAGAWRCSGRLDSRTSKIVKSVLLFYIYSYLYVISFQKLKWDLFFFPNLCS